MVFLLALLFGFASGAAVALTWSNHIARTRNARIYKILLGGLNDNAK